RPDGRPAPLSLNPLAAGGTPMPRSRCRARTALAAGTALCWLSGAVATWAGGAGAPAKHYALLVGCTEYQHCKAVPPLDGPANDIPRFVAVLSALGFPNDHITR